MAKTTITIRAFEIQCDWKVALPVAIALCLLVSLGVWQLQRADEKRQLNNELDRRQQAAPVPFDSLMNVDREKISGRKVSLQGHYLNDRSIVIANQFFRGRSGFEVFTPFQPDAGDQLVLVSRGWRAATQPGGNVRDIPAIGGHRQLFAQLIVAPQQSFFVSESVGDRPWPLHLHHFDFATIASLFNRPLSPFIARLDKQSPGVLTRHWRSKRLDPGTNTSYAIQWFGMALLLSVAVLIASSNIVQLLHTRFNKR